MTAVLPPAGRVELMTIAEVREELGKLTRKLQARGMTLEEFKGRGERWELDADDRGLLGRIRSLEFLSRRPR